MRLVVASLALAIACSSEAIFLGLPPAPANAEQSFYILVVSDPETGHVASALVRTIPSEPVRLSVEPEVHQTLHLLWCEGSPDQRGLALGELKRATTGGPEAPLPRPAQAWTSDLSASPNASWLLLSDFDPTQLDSAARRLAVVGRFGWLGHRLRVRVGPRVLGRSRAADRHQPLAACVVQHHARRRLEPGLWG